MKRTCEICEKEFEIKNGRKYCEDCIPIGLNRSESIKYRRKAFKKELVKLLGGECIHCGFKEFISALELHHINPKEKEFSISCSNFISFETLLKESKKCVLICSNCHRGVHANEININFKKQDYTLIQKRLKKNNQNKTKAEMESICPECGQKKDKTAKLCFDCSKKKQRKVKNRPTKQQLLNELKKSNYVQVGKKYGVSDNTIRKWLK